MNILKFNYKRLKAERIAKGLTVQEMADVLGVAKGTYSKKENGKLPLTVEDFTTITNRLEISFEELNIFFTKIVSESETIEMFN